MANATSSPEAKRWRRRFFLVIAVWLITTVLMSDNSVRGIVAYPLYVHDEQATADVAYVMADGDAYWERLRTASDLYHWKRVSRIVILKEERSDGYNFLKGKSDSRFERSVEYLMGYGVPRDHISGIQEDQTAWLGSLSEAHGFAAQFPDVKDVVVVTSAPHTRRSKLCFQRTLAADAKVQVYAASIPRNSSEITAPIWIEYVKLLVYLVVA